MDKKLKKSLIYLLIIFIVNVLFMFLVMFVDKAKTGIGSQVVGLSSINIKIRDAIGTSKFFDVLSNIILGITLIIIVFEVVYTLIELIKRKKLSKIDKELYALIAVYALVGVAYVFFDYILVINTRPVLNDWNYEASFPSSHTLLVLVTASTGITITNLLTDNKKYRYISYAILGVLAIFIIISRMLSGEHWFTDIIGGILLAGFFYQLYQVFLAGLSNPKYQDVSDIE